MQRPGPIIPAILFTAVLWGCDNREEIQVYRVAKEASVISPVSGDPHAGLLPDDGKLPAGHPSMNMGGPVAGEAPADWTPGRESMLRRASYAVETGDGRKVDISLVALRGSAGGVLENINLWREQLGQAPIEESQLAENIEIWETAAGNAIAVDIEGLAESSDPTWDGRTVAAIIERPLETWFFKMRGNAELVGEQKTAFQEWVTAVKVADEGEGTTVAQTGETPAAGEASTGAPGIAWQLPPDWIPGAAKPMRVATFQVKGPGGETGEATVVRLGGDAGGNLANINRWRKQIDLPPLAADAPTPAAGTIEAGDVTLSTIGLAGPEDRTLAAWTQHDGATWFFKLTGPAAAVTAHEENFTTFLQSIRFTGE